jgi:ribosomal protein S18 acetylase RimI-like enzyme
MPHSTPDLTESSPPDRPERATSADYAAILSSLEDFWGERDVRHLHHPIFIHELGDTSLVLRDPDGAVIAYLFGFVTPSGVGYIHAVGVRNTRRREGLARRLYDAFEHLAAEGGAHALKAITAPSNEASIAFHRSLGMTDTEVADYVGSGQTRVVFSRELRSKRSAPQPGHAPPARHEHAGA